MLPIVLDPSVLRIGVAGRGEGLSRRLKMLERAGVTPAVVFHTAPTAQDIATLRVLFVAGLDDATSEAVAKIARAAQVFVNVEDRPELCDFHVPAQVRRGDLVLTVSTGGRAPGLASALRQELEESFGPEWDARLDRLARQRLAWREEGLSPAEVSKRTRAVLDDEGWLA